MSFREAVSKLRSLQLFGVKLGLRNIRILLELLGNPERSFRSVHIAGTNGKGSVAALMAAALADGGFKTGLYTSPHLISEVERIRVASKEIGEEVFTRRTGEVFRAIDRGMEEGRFEAHPTYFEVMTAVAFHHFSREGVEIAVVETGLGGRLDATNVLDPALAVITRIALDHENHLGGSLEEICREKGAIIKAGTPVVVAPQEGRVIDILRDTADSKRAPFHSVSEEVEATFHRDGSLELATPGFRHRPLKPSLPGGHQKENMATAVRALEVLSRAGFEVKAKAIEEAFSTAVWRGRLEWVDLGEKRVLLDCAHNPDAARSLREYIQSLGEADFALLFAAMRDKDYGGMIAELAPIAGRVVVTRVENERSAPPEKLLWRAMRHNPRTTVAPDIETAVANLLGEDFDFTVVTGSIYLVGEFLRKFDPSRGG